MANRRTSRLLPPLLAVGLLLLVGVACDREDNHWDAFDPDLKLLSVVSDTLHLAEGGPARTFRMSLQMVPSDTVRVLVAADDSQIVAEPETVLFVPVDDDWARPRTVSVHALEDRIDEELLVTGVSLLAVSRDAGFDGQGGPGVVPVVIADNDVAGVRVTETNLTLVESQAGTISETYRVHLLSQPVSDVTISVTATPADPSFHVDPTSLVFTPADWDTEQEIRLWAEIDEVDADNATIVLTHAAASADPYYDAGLAIAPVSVSLLDDTLPPTASLALAVPGTATLLESGGTVSLDVVVALDRSSVLPVTVHLATRDGTATGGADFQALDQDVVFAPGGALRQVFSVVSLDDNLMEDPEDFQVVISAVANAVVGPDNRLDLSIVDNDQITLSVAGVDADEDQGSAGFVVSIPFAVPLPVAFTLTTGDGTAVAGSDYDAVAAEFVIPPGRAQRLVPVVVRADPAHEGDEDLTAVLSGLSGNAVWDGVPAVAVIRDDDPQAVRFTGGEAVESTGNVRFHLALDAPYDDDLVLTVLTSDGDGLGAVYGPEDALGGEDYTVMTGTTWVLPAGTTRDSLAVTISADGVAETEREYLRLVIGAASEPGFAGLTAVATIRDADQPVILVGDATASEAMPAAVFTVSLQDRTGSPVTSRADVSFTYATVNQTAEGGLDYAAAGGVVTIPAGGGGATITVPILDDAHDDDNETFVLALASPVNATIADDGSAPFCLITDNEFPSINLAQTVAAENEGSVHEFTVFLTTPRQAATGFDLVLEPGTSGGPGTDYTFTGAGYRVIPPFTSSLTFQVPFLDDQLAGEPGETLRARLSNAEVALGVDVLDMTIIDAPVLNIQPDAAIEGEDLVFDVTLSAPSTADVSFRVQYSSGTANVLTDIVGTGTGPFTIPAGGVLRQVVTPTVAGDGGDLAVEDFVITVISPVNATVGAFNSATGRITDADPPPLTIAGDATAGEGDDVVFTVELGWTSGADVTFSLSFADGTAAGAGIDFDDAVTGPHTVPAGALSTSVAVPTVALDGPEAAFEDFGVTLTAPVNAVLGGAITATGFIADGDQPVLTIPAGDAATEGGDLFFTIHLDPPTIVPVFFDLVFGNGSTQGAADFVPSSTGPFSMMPGTTDTTITVGTVDDALFENVEQFVVRLAADPTNAVVGVPAQANGIINDND